MSLTLVEGGCCNDLTLDLVIPNKTFIKANQVSLEHIRLLYLN